MSWEIQYHMVYSISHNGKEYEKESTYVYIYIYIYTHTHTHTHISQSVFCTTEINTTF